MSSRREFFLATLASLIAGNAIAENRDSSEKGSSSDLSQTELMTKLAPHLSGNEQIALLLYPGFTRLDVFGPHHMFASLMGARVQLVAETAEPVKADTGVAVTPSATLDQCPKDLTILFVPGGILGTLNACENKSIIDFLKDRGSHAQFIASVCTGSLLLGAAGLLDGYEATSHWICRDQLKLFGAIPVDKRVVIDRNRITGAGVTAGLDFGLELVEQLRGPEYAQATQLFSEYDPQPKFNSGLETKAPRGLVNLKREMHTAFNDKIHETAKRVSSKS